MIRIIAGRHKRRKLFSVPGHSTRPTTDFNREMIFSSYQDYEGKRVLDLFAGTGAFGLEAISRGALWVDFVEFARPAIATLLKNVELLGCGDICYVHRKKVKRYLRSCPEPYDVIFLDPPYDKKLINPSLEAIYDGGILKEDGVIIVEHAPDEIIGLRFRPHLFKEKKSKNCDFSFLTSGL